MIENRPTEVQSGRKVVFVGGSSYSGSTMLDMMLAHGPSGFSCGEVGFMFAPYREHHFAARSKHDPRESSLWAELFECGPSQLYRQIFERNPGVTTIVDSTKDPLWIHDQTRYLKNQDIETRNVLIWKTPEEFFASRKKRGREFGWQRAWINYHALYFRLVPEWIGISYSQLAKTPSHLEAICRSLDIDYFSGKEEYWNDNYQTIFGNASAKVHLHAVGSDAHGGLLTDTPRDGASSSTAHQKISYDDQQRTKLKNPLRAVTLAIRDVLQTHDIADQNSGARAACAESSAGVRASELFVVSRRVSRQCRSMAASVVEGLRKIRLLPRPSPA